MVVLKGSERPTHVAGPLSPAAERAQRPGWRDPRLLLGLLLVAGCVLLGAKVMASADETVAVWSARADLAPGTVLERDDLRLTRVRFADGGAVEQYLLEGALPDGRTVLSREVKAGELLPRAALTSGGDPLVEVPLAVGRADLPATVRRGSVVDVWVAGSAKGEARQLLDDVLVVALPTATDSLAPESTRQVIVGVPEDSDRLAAVLGVGDGRLVVTQRSGSAAQP